MKMMIEFTVVMWATLWPMKRLHSLPRTASWVIWITYATQWFVRLLNIERNFDNAQTGGLHFCADKKSAALLAIILPVIFAIAFILLMVLGCVFRRKLRDTGRWQTQKQPKYSHENVSSCVHNIGTHGAVVLVLLTKIGPFLSVLSACFENTKKGFFKRRWSATEGIWFIDTKTHAMTSSSV